MARTNNNWRHHETFRMPGTTAMKNYTKTELEKIASDFLSQRGTSVKDGQRLMVDVILEQMGYRFVSAKGLFSKEGVDAFVAKDCKTIIVDAELMDSGSMRYTFTLAEELAHTILHIRGRNPAVVFKEIKNLSQSGYARMERDAKYLGAALLMPKVSFSQKYREKYDWHYGQMTQNNPKYADPVTSAKYALRQLYLTFGVSLGGAVHRARELGLINNATHHSILQYLGKQ